MSTWWCRWAASVGLRAEVRDRGELCLNEAAANIIRHGGGSSTMAILFESDADAVRMTIADDGEPFDPVTHRVAELPLALEDALPGGLGVRIVRASADRVTYRRVDGWNALTLTLMR